MLFGPDKRVISKILIVEDEPLIAFDNEHFLTHAGYEVVDTVDSCAHAELVIKHAKMAQSARSCDFGHVEEQRLNMAIYQAR
ncbi:hypothetical protein L3X40_11350, partial [Rhizorhapis sp. SPR117]|nr:hypothetical protein [Rhizorhapis sp. SPR117]